MSTLAMSVREMRAKAIDAWGLVAAFAFAWLIALGQLSAPRLMQGDLFLWFALAVYGLTLGRSLARDLELPIMGPTRPPTPSVSARSTRARFTAGLREFEPGVVLLVGVYLLLAISGGHKSFVYPLLYALVSYLAFVHQRRAVLVAWGACVVALELSLSRAYAGTAWHSAAITHLLFCLFFGVGNVLVLSGLAQRLRSRHGRAVSDELDRMRQEARDFRLIASQLPLDSRAVRTRDEEEARMAQGAVHAVHEQLFFQVDLLATALDLHSCALVWVRPREQGASGREEYDLVLKEIATRSELIVESPMLPGAGILSGILRDPKAVRLKALGGRRLPPWYRAPVPVTDLCALPILEGAALRGVLCADRTGDRPFTEAEEEVLRKAAQQLQRVIEHERSFAAVERGKYEQEKFYRASELLNQALTLGDVYSRSFVALGAIAPYDLCVLTHYDDARGRHRVLASQVSETARDLELWRKAEASLRDLEFNDGRNMVSYAVKNRHHVPATGEHADFESPVFGADHRLKQARSLLVLPLIRGERVIGTLTLASSRPRAYGAAVREMLRVIGHQVGTSLQNARMYEAMEERATTDGLTGLTNHRSFQERLDHLHALAERTGQRYSIILTDVDHFKSVNDTYGHPVGDAVLRRVANVFAGRARKVDIVARYGGEEFVLVLPDTDAEGAALFANRLREEVAAQTMSSDHGSFKITISMGVASFPADGTNRQELIERADQALYYCKEHGRNRVTRVAELVSAQAG